MVIKAENISRSVTGPDNKTITILKRINLEVFPSEFLAVMGPSGSGKTTLLQILGLMDTASAGELTILNKNVSQLSEKDKTSLRRNEIGFVFQKPLLISDLTLIENLKLVAKTTDKTITIKNILEILEKTGLKGKENHYPRMLSAGENQRGALARAAIISPAVLFADEPTSNLDKENKLVIMDILKRLNTENHITVVMATHDELVLHYSKRSLCLINGTIE
jgi:putative ABC transport system ATP-binding protein